MKISFYSDEQMNDFTNILDNTNKLLSPHDLLKINKPISFLSFILKEIYEYANLKAYDGNSVTIIRKMKIKSEKYIEKIESLKIFLV